MTDEEESSDEEVDEASSKSIEEGAAPASAAAKLCAAATKSVWAAELAQVMNTLPPLEPRRRNRKTHTGTASTAGLKLRPRLPTHTKCYRLFITGAACKSLRGGDGAAAVSTAGQLHGRCSAQQTRMRCDTVRICMINFSTHSCITGDSQRVLRVRAAPCDLVQRTPAAAGAPRRGHKACGLPRPPAVRGMRMTRRFTRCRLGRPKQRWQLSQDGVHQAFVDSTTMAALLFCVAFAAAVVCVGLWIGRGLCAWLPKLQSSRRPQPPVASSPIDLARTATDCNCESWYNTT